MQKLLDDSKSGKLPPCMHARVQGPFHSAAVSDIVLQSSQRLLVASGGIGLATVLPMLKRMALMRDEEESQAVSKTGAMTHAPFSCVPCFYAVHLHVSLRL